MKTTTKTIEEIEKEEVANEKKKLLFGMGLQIGDTRKSKGLTQEQLGEALNCGWKHVSNMERATDGVSLVLLIRLAEVLEVSTDYLLTGKEFYFKEDDNILRLEEKIDRILSTILSNFDELS